MKTHKSTNPFYNLMLDDQKKIQPTIESKKNPAVLIYTDKELLRQGWATIGGRVMDYVEMLKTCNRLKVWTEIKKIYDEDYDDVYRGVLAYQSMGINVYYNIDGRNN